MRAAGASRICFELKMQLASPRPHRVRKRHQSFPSCYAVACASMSAQAPVHSISISYCEPWSSCAVLHDLHFVVSAVPKAIHNHHGFGRCFATSVWSNKLPTVFHHFGTPGVATLKKERWWTMHFFVQCIQDRDVVYPCRRVIRYKMKVE